MAKTELGAATAVLGEVGPLIHLDELGALRHEVLAYAAVPLELEAAAGEANNPEYRRELADYVQDAPPRLILWSTLGAAVIALLFVTWRIVGRTSPPRT